MSLHCPCPFLLVANMSTGCGAHSAVRLCFVQRDRKLLQIGKPHAFVIILCGHLKQGTYQGLPLIRVFHLRLTCGTHSTFFPLSDQQFWCLRFNLGAFMWLQVTAPLHNFSWIVYVHQCVNITVCFRGKPELHCPFKRETRLGDY